MGGKGADGIERHHQWVAGFSEISFTFAPSLRGFSRTVMSVPSHFPPSLFILSDRSLQPTERVQSRTRGWTDSPGHEVRTTLVNHHRRLFSVSNPSSISDPPRPRWIRQTRCGNSHHASMLRYQDPGRTVCSLRFGLRSNGVHSTREIGNFRTQIRTFKAEIPTVSSAAVNRLGMRGEVGYVQYAFFVTIMG